ncbi:dUTP diphosphatase [Acetobacter pasteurianus]|uniref:dUTP diphosphatase n=1 Tax=Acetobacter pasteurianus TaxID=438 RepID=UPI0013641029|nr:dUTP diphosphatase [Acetobacter pasteurianus]QHM90074.1 dUTP diphosphatase [Acetobacter pasteurianus]
MCIEDSKYDLSAVEFGCVDFALQATQKFGPIQNALNARANKKPWNWCENDNNWSRAIKNEAIEMQDHIGWKWWGHSTPHFNRAFMEVVDIFHFWISAILQVRYESTKKGVPYLSPTFDAMKSGSDLLCELKEIEKAVNEHLVRRRIQDELPDVQKRIWRQEAINSFIDLMVLKAAKAGLHAAEHDLEANYIQLLHIGYIIQILCIFCGRSVSDLFKWYAGKNALNLFRWDNGYKKTAGEKGYIKIWSDGDAPQEDNDYLEYMILDHKDEGSGENETSSEATWLQKFYDMLAAEYKNVLATKDRNEDRSANVSSWKDCESKKFVESLIAG